MSLLSTSGDPCLFVRVRKHRLCDVRVSRGGERCGITGENGLLNKDHVAHVYPHRPRAFWRFFEASLRIRILS